MKRTILFFFFAALSFSSFSQSAGKKNKYPSLLWEISGLGMKKPSYLIGTMHVSNKLAFNLPDSFYTALRTAQVVALETNPETWQEDMNRYDIGDGARTYGNGYAEYLSIPNDYLAITTLKFYKYDSKIERSLYSSPATINNLLYRSYGNESSDFEEDTYLDMYIYQCGKKWGKKVAGVENYGESMRLMAEAYKDASKDKSRKERSYGDADEEYSIEKLQEAYRSGNLDLLDSINRYNSFSKAFDEKFLFRRNEIQARSIDSIIRSGNILFVGVGAAHLPGDRGVIELLRKKGYRLRPVKMGERASREKDMVDRIHVPVVFHTETADDGLYKVDVPGKFYKAGEDPALEQRQYADMANGSFYMVTRIMTNAWMWSHTQDDVYRTLDSLLYENIPGKIISKATISKNGYKGIDVINRTRRGDIQRYNIFVTPFEIVFFKMGGTGDYVTTSTEAKKFFGSIQMKEYKSHEANSSWKKYSPHFGGFAVDLPHDPYIGNDGSWIFDAGDKQSNTHYRVIRTDIHNYHFVEEDSFDLGLMDESFSNSDFIQKQTSRKFSSWKGYPSLDASFLDKDGQVYLVKYIIQGPHYYTLVAHGRTESQQMKNFIQSFELKPYQYGETKIQRDSLLYYSVTTPVYPDDKKIRISIPTYGYGSYDSDEDESEEDALQGGTFRSKVVSNDSTGESIYISFYRSGRYEFAKDSAMLEKDNESTVFGNDSTWIVRSHKKYTLPNNMKVWESSVTDTGSSRVLWARTYYKDGIGFTIATQTDTLSQPSPFVKKFFDSFTPADTLKGINPFERKSKLFFSDLASNDSVLHKRAVKQITTIELEDADLPALKAAITNINWSEKKYLDTKRSLVFKLGDIKTAASDNYLKELYYAAQDTVQLQYAILESLLQHKTSNAYQVFRDIIRNEPPVLEMDGDNYSAYRINMGILGDYDNGDFIDELSDSLLLTKQILPDLLALINLDDYQPRIMEILSKMVDENLLSAKDYESYYQRFMLEAKQALKKQLIEEKKKAIEKAEEDKEEETSDDDPDTGNEDLDRYATLLLPFWEKEQAVPTMINQMLSSSDKQLRYNTLMLLVRKNKPYPDSLLKYFASQDQYRYQLYSDLKKNGQESKFPSLYRNHHDLGISELYSKHTYGKPDSIVFLDRLYTSHLGKKGYIYFYKVKEKKDDVSWKLAAVGLVPEDPGQIEFTDSTFIRFNMQSPLLPKFNFNRYDFTGFSDTKFKEDEAVMPQLQLELKKLMYSRRKSAKEFYEDSTDRTTVDSE